MGAPSHDRNLLFGILAVQMDFISRDALVAAMNAWVLTKDKALGEILASQGALSVDRRMLLEALVKEHLKQHGNDAEKSLAAVSSLGPVQNDLRQIGDAEVQASLVRMAAARTEVDPLATRAQTVGSSTSLGTRFRILRPHARGGLGQVSVARDEELQREVALKEIQERHADEPDSRNRFLLEAEITGGLEHPGIVPVYGLGQYADGRPYYAMRFIRGDSLQDALASFHKSGNQRLDSGERAVELRGLLGRFIDVCNAIAYAHSRGVLHRDLKPGNIMLGQYGETLVVDWGLAKAQDPSDTKTKSVEGPIRPSSLGGSAETVMGSTIGTPQYMSPEQSAGRLDLLGAASDVYSLGATLYCILTGRAPIEGPNVESVLRNVQRGEFAPPRAVNGQIPKPLEAICLKAMSLKPEDRYQSPKDLAGDVEHWLADEPVAAYREPWTAKAARWGRKHKTLVAGAFALVVTAAIALAVSAVLIKKQQLLTEAAREDAITARDAAQRRFRLALDALNDMVQGIQTKLEVRPDTEDLRRDLLENARRRVQELLQEAQRQGNPDQTLVWTYFRMGDVDQVLGDTLAAKKEYTSGSDLAIKLAEAAPHDSSAQSDLGIGYINLGNIAQQLGQTQEALDDYHKALLVRQQRAEADPKDSKAQRGLSINYELLGDVTKRMGRSDEALDFYRKSSAICQQLADADATNLQAQYDLGVIYERLGDATLALGRTHEALDFYQKCSSIRARLAEADPKNARAKRSVALTSLRLGDVALRLDQTKEAQSFYQKAVEICESLAEADPKNAQAQRDLDVSYQNLGDLLRRLGRPAEAVVLYEKVSAICERLAQADPKNALAQRNLSMSYLKLGEVSLLLGNKPEALDLCQKALAIRDRLATADPKNIQAQRDLAFSYEKLGDVTFKMDRLKESLDFYQRAQAIYDRLAADVSDVNARSDVAAGCFHIASVFARMSASAGKDAGEKYAAQAMSFLQRAVAAGFDDLARLTEDKDLDALREREDFTKLIAELKQKTPGAKQK